MGTVYRIESKVVAWRSGTGSCCYSGATTTCTLSWSASQPKLLLDATVSEELLRALYPSTPIQIVRLAIPIPGRVTQVLGADWAKSTVRGPSASAGLTQWSAISGLATPY